MQSFDETLQIDTPENVIFGYQVAGIGSRFLAALVDTTLIILLQAITFAAIFVVISGLELFSLDDRAALGWGLGILGLVSFLFLWGYYIFFEVIWNGQSPGKRLNHLRVIRTDGTPIGLTESIIRNLVRLIDFLPFYYGIGVVVMFINEQSRRLGDLAAGTLVVREDQQEISLDSLETSREQASEFRPTVEGLGALPIEKLNEQDLALIRNYLGRKGELENSAALAARILKHIFDRMELPADEIDAWEAERILTAIARASRITTA